MSKIKDFLSRQLDRDNKAVHAIEVAAERRDAKAVEREARKWEKEDAREARAASKIFDKQ